MVAASELPWRKLSRRIGGADLCYSPMISSSSFVNSLRAKGKSAQRSVLNWFNTATREEGHGQDSKLIIQLAGNDPTVLLEAATHLQSHCLGIDLNLGCPQHIAKRGHYGSFLQEDWPLIHSLISTLHTNLTVPVTAKMRVFPSVEHTIAYARMLEHAGAQIITVHGRTREQKGHKTGLADWEMIRAVKSAVSVPVFANGNVLYREDVQACLSATGADGVMSAEGNLYNPLIFAGEQLLSSLPTSLLPYRDSDASSPEAAWRPFPYIPALAHEYLDEVAACRKRVDHSAVKGHMFKICRPALERHKELRGVLGKAQLRYVDAEEREEEAGQGQGEAVVREYREAISALDEKLTADKQDPLYLQPPKDWGSSSLSASVTEEKYVPHWLAQPYFRPALPLPEEKTKGEKKGEVEKVGVDTRDVQGRGEKRVVDLEEAIGGEANEKGNAEDGHKKLQLLLEEAQQFKLAANTAFERGDYEAAISEYRDALASLPPREPMSETETQQENEAERRNATPAQASASVSASANSCLPSSSQLRELTPLEQQEEERLAALTPSQRLVEEERARSEREVHSLRTTLWSNLAACELKARRWERAKEACDEALTLEPLHLKSLHRRATACEEVGSYSSLCTACEDLTALLKHPGVPPTFRPTLRSTLARVEKKKATAGEKERDEMLGKLKGLGDKVLGGLFGLSTDNFKFEKNKDGGYGVQFRR